MAREMERSTVEAYGGVALGVLVVVIPLHWYVQAFLIFIVACLAFDVALRAPPLKGWSIYYRIALWAITAIILVTISFNPIKNTYVREHQDIAMDDARRIGRELSQLSRDILGFVSDRQSNAPSNFGANPGEIRNAWAQRRKYSQDTVALAYDRFGSRVLESLSVLKEIGIEPPFQIKLSMDTSPGAMAKWLGTIGGFLEEGKLNDAKKIGADSKFWFDFQN